MKTLSLKLPESLFAMLTAASEKRGESKSTVVREAIAAYIRAQQSVHQGSCLDLANDLAGCVDGPEDLSSNKTHMRRYGQ